MQRKRSRRRRRERSGDESKTAIDSPIVGGTRTGNGTGNGGDGGGGGNDVVNVNGITGDGSGDHHHRTDAIDDGLEKNPDIIPHDNGKKPLKKRTRPHYIKIAIVICE